MGLTCSSGQSGNKKIAQVKDLQPDGEWTLPKGTEPRMIRSIHIAVGNGLVYLVDYENDSIIELDERGEIRTEFHFDEQNNENHFLFTSFDVCSISPDILVACGKQADDDKMAFIQRNEKPPFLELQKQIPTNKTHILSLCSQNDTILGLDLTSKVHSFSKEGEKIKTGGIDGVSASFGFKPRIRVDPSSGDLWWSSYDSFASEAKSLDLAKKGGKIDDFCFDKSGHLYFATKEGIFSAFPKLKLLHKFHGKSDYLPLISVSENKLIACVQHDANVVIKVFKIIHGK